MKTNTSRPFWIPLRVFISAAAVIFGFDPIHAAEAHSPTPSEALAEKVSSLPDECVPFISPALVAPEAWRSRFRYIDGMTFSPDGNECFIVVGAFHYQSSQLYVVRHEPDGWSEPAPVSFAPAREKGMDAEVFYATQDRIIFTSDRDSPAGKSLKRFWEVDRTASGWSEPRLLPPPFNTAYQIFDYSETPEGAWFVSNRSGGPGGFDVCHARKTASGEIAVLQLGAPVNTPGDEWDPAISPDGTLMIVGAVRHGGHGGSDLYLHRRKGDGSWTDPINLGPEFNSSDDEFQAAFSRDGQWFYFSRHSHLPDGRADVYWVKSSALPFRM